MFERIKRTHTSSAVDVELYHHIAVGDVVNEYQTNLDGCGYIVAKGETVDLAEQAAAEVLNLFAESIF